MHVELTVHIRSLLGMGGGKGGEGLGDEAKVCLALLKVEEYLQVLKSSMYEHAKNQISQKKGSSSCHAKSPTMQVWWMSLNNDSLQS